MASSRSTASVGGVQPSPEKAIDSEDTPRSLGRYLLLRRLARGGMGEVFLASTTGLEGAERPVVVKIIRREHAKDPSFIARFLDEARVQAQLQHSGVAQVLDATTDDATGEPYAVVEYVEGRSLGDLRGRAIQTGKAIAWPEAVAIATLIAEALAHVHERKDPSGRALGIVHRDLSPQNVMVSYTGECKIIDFGTARGHNRRCHTVAGVVFAKPGYVAPEVANGDSGDARVDLYALGVILWELCAGRRFLQGDSAVHMAAVARNEKSLPPIAHEIGAPPELDAIIQKLTAFDKATRYAVGPAPAADLARVLGSAAALPTGERGVRARTAYLMKTLFPGELDRSRKEFARLIAEARGAKAIAEPRAPAANTETKADDGLLPGTRYRIVRELGRGESSVVYEVEHLDLGRRFAVKVIAAEHSRSPSLANRFRREARVLSRLSHDGLAAIHDVGQTKDGRLFCVMELLEGETLEAYLAREKGVDWREGLAIAERALRALEVTHAAGLVHRDIKPANLFLTNALRPSHGLKLLDFGLCRGGSDPEATESEPGSCASFTIFGTPEYMAPEQAASGQIDARADLYALGCVLYEMLTGKLPFSGPSAVAVLDAKIKGSPERPRDAAPTRQIPVSVDEIVCRALARHPSMRFQTATEMRLAIQRVLEAKPKNGAAGRIAMGGVAAVLAALALFVVSPKGQRIRSSFAWPTKLQALAHHPAPTPPVVETATTLAPPPAEAPSAQPTLVARAEDGFDAGEDGDFVDDQPEDQNIVGADLAYGPPPPPEGTQASESKDAPPKVAQAPAKTRHHKRAGSPAAPAKAASATSTDGSEKRKAGQKSDKPARRRHKNRMAEVQ